MGTFEEFKSSEFSSAKKALLDAVAEMEKEPFFKEVRSRMDQQIPEMPDDVVWPVRKIWGPDEWEQLDKDYRIAAGKYVSFLVDGDILPLSFVKYVNNSRYYKKN